jgi:hypothetical protein
MGAVAPGSSKREDRDIALAGLRLDRPTPARMYHYFLGGKDNFQVDRDAAGQLDEDPYGIVGTFRDAVVPGSYLVLSHVTTDGLSAELLDRNKSVYERATSPSRPRSRDEIARFFDGLDLLEPGLVRPGLWRPEPDRETATNVMYAGVGTKTA